MQLILNERKYAEHILESGEMGNNTSAAIGVLAKYYRQAKGLGKKETCHELDKIMAAAYPGYVPTRWANMLERAAKQADKYPLIELEGIPVTDGELQRIGRLESRELQKLAFTLLVAAKYFNATRENNRNWVNCDPSEVFAMANLNESRAEQARLYALLTRHGIITYSMKTGSVNAQVLIIDETGEAAYLVPDLRSLGHEYLKLLGQSYERCKKCGLLFRQAKGGRRVYCRQCAENRSGSGMRFSRFKCIDCGKETFVAGHNSRSIRCPGCQAIARRQMKKEADARRYLRIKAERAAAVQVLK